MKNDLQTYLESEEAARKLRKYDQYGNMFFVSTQGQEVLINYLRERDKERDDAARTGEVARSRGFTT